MAKATHKGNCQWCGSLQKLPNHRLSKHGYTKKYNFFMGTCKGAEHPPLQESCNLTEESIEWASNEIIRLEREIATLQEPATEAKAWIKYRKDFAWHWGYFDIIDAKHYQDSQGKQQSLRMSKHGYFGTDIMEIVKILNQDRIDFYQTQIKQLKNYCIEQQAVVDAWKPSALLPL